MHALLRPNSRSSVTVSVRVPTEISTNPTADSITNPHKMQLGAPGTAASPHPAASDTTTFSPSSFASTPRLRSPPRTSRMAEANARGGSPFARVETRTQAKLIGALVSYT